MIYAAPGSAFEATVVFHQTGLVGTIGVRVTDNQGVDTIARTTAGITEYPSGSGRYQKTITAPTVAGQYDVVWDNAAGPSGWASEELFVTSSVAGGGVPSGSDLCTLADVKTALEISASDTSRDTLIAALITSASEAIMNEVDREFAPVTSSATRRFRVEGLQLNLAPYDLRSVSTLTLHPESTSPQTLTATSDYQLLPVGSPSGTFTSLRFSGLLASLYASQTVFSFGYALVDIAGAWGFASVPLDVTRACVITVGSWLRKDVTALLAAGELDTGGGLAPAFPATMELPHAATALLSPFYRLRTWVS